MGGDYGESCLHPDEKKNGDVDMLELLEEGDIDMQEITFNSAAKVARLQHLDALEADKPVRAATEIFRRPAYAYTGLCPDAKWRGVEDNGKE